MKHNKIDFHFLFPSCRCRLGTTATSTKSLSTRSLGCRVSTEHSSTALTKICSETSHSSTRGWLASQGAETTSAHKNCTVTDTNCTTLRQRMSQNCQKHNEYGGVRLSVLLLKSVPVVSLALVRSRQQKLISIKQL